MQSETAIGNEAVRILKLFSRTGDVMSCVNKANGREEETFKLTVRHLAGDGVLAHCFSTFMQFGWNVQDLKHVSFDARKACATNVTFNAASASVLIQRPYATPNKQTGNQGRNG